MGKNRSLKRAVKKLEENSNSKTKAPNQIIISEVEASYFGLGSKAANSNYKERPYVSLKYFDGAYQCFSEWTREELIAFTTLLRKVSQMTWTQILASGGKCGKKTGLGCTRLAIGLLPASSVNGLSEDLNFMELRVTEKARIHGFRVKEAFFLVCLDREHKVCPV